MATILILVHLWNINSLWSAEKEHCNSFLYLYFIYINDSNTCVAILSQTWSSSGERPQLLKCSFIYWAAIPFLLCEFHRNVRMGNVLWLCFNLNADFMFSALSHNDVINFVTLTAKYLLPQVLQACWTLILGSTAFLMLFTRSPPIGAVPVKLFYVQFNM